MENSENTGNFIPPLQPVEEPKHKAPVLLIVAVVVLVLGLVGLGTAYYFQMSQAKDLQRKVDDLNAAAAEMDEHMAEMDQQPAASDYREIPELGVKYKATDATKGLTYQFTSDGSAQMIGFSTEELTTVRLGEGDAAKYPCTSDAMPGGVITRFKEGSSLKVGPSDITSTNKKIGEYYYLLQAPQASCGAGDAATTAKEQAAVKAVQKAFETLEAL